MTFKAGMKRPEGAGRKKGTPNKASLRVLDQLLDQGINPLQEAIKLLTSGGFSPEKTFDGWMRIVPYCFPQLKAIEVSGELETGGVSVTAENVAMLCKIAREAALPAKGGEAS